MCETDRGEWSRNTPEPQQLCVSSSAHSGPPGPPPSSTAGHSSLSADDSAAPPAETQTNKINRPVNRWAQLCCHFVR